AGDQAALVERIKAITGLADDEIALLGKIFEKRVTQLGTKGDYTHVVDQRIGMELAAVDHNRAGDLYFSHVDTAHRLMIPRDH
ncbi:hypothetical protein, partial [Klebsiella pneumoniae]|uniref:hypothetical protein n=1 Tax=Klebsiella pneumoniae TaxID=573 RepID=UPI003012A197